MDPKLGGVCQAVRTMIRGLAEREGVESEVVTLDAPSGDFLKQDSFIEHAVGPGKGPWSFSTGLMPWLLENLPRFDVVIIHGLWLYHGYAVRKALNLLGSRKLSTPNSQPSTSSQLPRCYVMPHGMLDPYFQRDPSRRFKAVRNTFYWMWIERKVVNDADGLLFTCEEEKLLARETFRSYQPRQESVVGLGVEDPPASTPAMKTAFEETCQGLNGQPYLLFLSRIHPKKGVDLLIRAYAEFVSKVEIQKSKVEENSSPTANCSLLTDHFPSLVIAGPLDSTYAREMQALAAELLPVTLKTENLELGTLRIHFVGMLQGDAKWGAFHGCEAFVLPSHQENFGIAVVEALACGKPVLISNKVNIWREIIDAGAGASAADTKEGTTALLEGWLRVGDVEREVQSIDATSAFNKYFSTRSAADRIFRAISA